MSLFFFTLYPFKTFAFDYDFSTTENERYIRHTKRKIYKKFKRQKKKCIAYFKPIKGNGESMN